ncbi:hypothetical protein EP7_000457 [Isosphaeraceae bacterium EP7]
MRARRNFSPALDSLPFRIVPSAYPPTLTITPQPSSPTTPTTGLNPMAPPTIVAPPAPAPGAPVASDPMAPPIIG